MNQQLSTEELINEIYRNARVAMQSINDIKTHVEDQKLLDELNKEYNGYEQFLAKVTIFMKDNNFTLHELGAFKKAMMWSMINANAFFDDSRSHIAEMMIKGTTTGISELYQIVNGKVQQTNPTVLDLAKTLISLEEEYIENLKAFL